MNEESQQHPVELVTVQLSHEEVAAVEGWRVANNLKSRSDAMRQLVRMGLLGEIGRLYQSVTRPEEGS
jgi:Arc/MetJ-type ribon-helix-helix transcriptional regulator